MEAQERKEIVKGRKAMVKALNIHFECVKMSEMGVKSARALRGQEGRSGNTF